MIMPKQMQILKLRDELRSVGISSDLVDVDQLVDSRLSYPENAQNIMNQFQGHRKLTKKSTRGHSDAGTGGNVDMRYAAQYHQTRTPRARNTDESQRNQRTYTEKQIQKNPSLLDTWFNNPGNSDIFGIDAFGSSKVRPKRKTKRKNKR